MSAEPMKTGLPSRSRNGGWPTTSCGIGWPGWSGIRYPEGGGMFCLPGAPVEKDIGADRVACGAGKAGEGAAGKAGGDAA
jgi:hypothetical protein